MPTNATDMLANGEIGAEAPAGQHTNEQAGSHDCKLVVAPTGQGITASLEARAGRTLLPAESNLVQNMTTDSNPALTPSEEEVQKPASAPSVQPQSSNGCTPEVASGSPVSTLSNTSENKPEGVNLPAAAEGELSAEAESGSSAATNSTYTKAMNANQTNPVSSGSAEENAQGNSCEQTVQPSVEINSCAASPGETEQIASSQAEPPSAVSTDSINSDAAAEAPASAEADNNNSNTITTMSTNNDTPANGSVSDVNATDVSNITSENAAALASANLNSGTDCATTPDMTMNKSYTTKCSVARHKKPSFTITRSLARNSDNITFNYGHGIPSNATHVHPTISRLCELTEPTTVSASGTVDDSVTIIAPGIDYTSTSGATHPFSVSAENVPAGIYPVFVSHYNIMNHPAGNVSELKGSLGPCPPITIIPDENDEVECDPCSCSCGIPGDNNGGEPPSNTRSIDNITIAPFTSSSGGGGVVRMANARHMRFAFAFGSFRGMGNIPGGQPEIVAFNYDESLLTPASLTYKHPLASVLVPEGDTVDVNEGFRIFDGAAYTNYIVAGDGSAAYGIGATTKKSEVVRFVSALSKDDSVVCNLSAANYVRISSADDSAVFYHLTGEEKNEFAAYISPDGATIEADEKLSIIRDTETGIIRQIWNYWDGLADVVPATGGNGYTISLYLPSQIVAPEQEGQLFTFTGNPFKSFTVSGDAVAKTMTIRERDWSLPENMPDYVTTWTHTEAGWNKATGEDDDIISETRVKSAIEGTDNYQIVTTVSKGNEVASRVCEVFTSTGNGELLLSRTDAYGSDIAQTTTFEYDEAGRQIRRVEHSGAVYETVYDIYGRVIAESSPWAGGQKRLTTTTYRVAGSSNTDPAKVVHSVVTTSGSVVDMKTDSYTYTEADGVRRVEISSAAAGVSEPQVTVHETWLSNATNPHARGRVKMSQAVNGVQTHYEYATNAAYGAFYTVTSETRVNGAAVAGQSRRTVEYVAANGNTMREEEYALLSDGETWALLSGVTNTYDEKNRLVGTLKDNGRSTSRTLNCSGQVLSETDEDGITTIYGYTNTRLLVEMTRSEVSIPAEDGTDSRIIVTPETITTYTYDAMGRTLSIRRDIGAMSTTEYTEYDLLGRIVRTVDVLGRVTTSSYSADGLTTTVTTPAGATFITSLNTDGSVARVAGTGQRELVYVYDINGNNRRKTTKLIDNTIIHQIITNGFDQTIVEANPNTLNGFIYTRSEFNAKGQKVKQYQDTGWNTTATTVTLHEYDDFGNRVKNVHALADTPTKDNSPVFELETSCISLEDGIYQELKQIRYNSQGETLYSIQRNLISSLSHSLVMKRINVDERNNVWTMWRTYNGGSQYVEYRNLATSDCTEETQIIDSFIVSKKNHHDVRTSMRRIFTATGMIVSTIDGRNNESITKMDVAGRTILEQDSANNCTSITYSEYGDWPVQIVNPLNETANYNYDIRGRKIAEWGSAIEPACFEYDIAGRVIKMKTYRVCDSTILTDPSSRTDADETCWEYDAATGLEIKKIRESLIMSQKTYDLYNRLVSEQNARGIVKTYIYENDRGLLLAVSYSDETPSKQYSYNHLGKLVEVADGVGVRTFSYNAYDEIDSESLSVDNDVHEIIEERDNFGRSLGFLYQKNGVTQYNAITNYSNNGRINAAGFVHNGVQEFFHYDYLTNTNMLHTLIHPNGIKLQQEYVDTLDLVHSMSYWRGETLVSQRVYTHDSLGRLTTRQNSRHGNVNTDTFSYDSRSALIHAQINGNNYDYSYDNCLNRIFSNEENAETTYVTNSLNQYTTITSENAVYSPQYDEDGNQTYVQNSSGEWVVSYNADNKPMSFVNEAEGTRIDYTYDISGCRSSKKVTVNGTVTLHHRYIYRKKLQIAAIDLTRSSHPALWFVTWDPTQNLLTRPLAIQKNGTWYTYGWDVSKNVCELFNTNGIIQQSYSYGPYGAVTERTTFEQPFKWSSEYCDSETCTVNYHNRVYDMTNGRWLSQDKLGELAGFNLYAYAENCPPCFVDAFGNIAIEFSLAEYARNGCKGNLTVPPFAAVDWDVNASISLNIDFMEPKISGVLETSAELGVTLGFALRRAIKTYTIFAMIGIRGSATVETTSEIYMKGNKGSKCPSFGTASEATLTAKLEGGVLGRLFDRDYEELAEVGLSVYATYKAFFESKLECTGCTCSASYSISLDDKIEYGAVANLHFFEVEYTDEKEFDFLKDLKIENNVTIDFSKYVKKLSN